MNSVKGKIKFVLVSAIFAIVLLACGSGDKKTGWEQKDGKEVYVKNGKAASGLQEIDGKSYILDEDGVPYEGWFEFDMVPSEVSIRDRDADICGKYCVIGSELNEELIKQDGYYRTVYEHQLGNLKSQE